MFDNLKRFLFAFLSATIFGIPFAAIAAAVFTCMALTSFLFPAVWFVECYRQKKVWPKFGDKNKGLKIDA